MRARHALAALRSLLRPLPLLALSAATLGCVPAVKWVESPVVAPPAFSRSGTAVLPERWWQAFRDPDLDRLVEEALAGNFTLRTARDRLAQARAVELIVPVDHLRWIRVPGRAGGEGSLVSIHDPATWGRGVFRQGRVLRLAPDLEEQGRMARLIVEIEDPLAQKPEHTGQPRLLIGSFVEAEIVGGELPAAAALERRLVRDGDTVWVMNDQGRLEIRPVTIAHRGPDKVLVTGGITAGERLVSSDLATAVQGMPLRLVRAGSPRAGSSGPAPTSQRAAPR